MKNLKLSNLEKMQQKEMQQVKGGESLPYIHYAKTSGGERCWCAGTCESDGMRRQEGISNSRAHSY